MSKQANTKQQDSHSPLKWTFYHTYQPENNSNSASNSNGAQQSSSPAMRPTYKMDKISEYSPSIPAAPVSIPVNIHPSSPPPQQKISPNEIKIGQQQQPQQQPQQPQQQSHHTNTSYMDTYSRPPYVNTGLNWAQVTEISHGMHSPLQLSHSYYNTPVAIPIVATNSPLPLNTTNNIINHNKNNHNYNHSPNPNHSHNHNHNHDTKGKSPSPQPRFQDFHIVKLHGDYPSSPPLINTVSSMISMVKAPTPPPPLFTPSQELDSILLAENSLLSPLLTLPQTPPEDAHIEDEHDDVGAQTLGESGRNSNNSDNYSNSNNNSVFGGGDEDKATPQSGEQTPLKRKRNSTKGQSKRGKGATDNSSSNVDGEADVAASEDAVDTGKREKRGAAVQARGKTQAQIQIKPATRSTAQQPATTTTITQSSSTNSNGGNMSGRKSRNSNKGVAKDLEPEAKGKKRQQRQQGARGKTNDDEEKQMCFICGQALSGDLDDVNQHIDSCLAASGDSTPKEKGRRRGRNSSTPNNDEFETYTIAGQTRVRACTLMGDDYADALGSVNSQKKMKTKKETDDDTDLNIDGDDTLQFGEAQFSETDLVAFNMDDEDAIMPNNLQTKLKGGKASNNNSNMSNTGPVVIDSLKIRIRDLEQSVANIPQCKICLGSYSTPLVSINCWHVHCEQCWMSTLGAKKLCPQCKFITCPGDLRRIYM